MKPAVVTGGRDVIPTPTMICQFEVVIYTQEVEIIFAGEHNSGVDAWVRNWCRSNGFPYAGFRAWWDFFGRAAGPVRNMWMVAVALRIDGILIAFPGGRGTRDCVERGTLGELKVFQIEGD